MGKRVVKYELDRSTVIAQHEGSTTFEVVLPADAKVLSAGTHGAQAVPCIWALVDEPAEANMAYHFIAIYTDADFPTQDNYGAVLGELRFLCTFEYGGNMVYHLFEIG